jgi:signal transduction histidine kinase/DNA-binding response OmpR family regulator
MAAQRINDYLAGFVNRSENIPELMKLYMLETDSKSCAFFMRVGGTNNYSCIEHIKIDSDIEHNVSYTTSSIVENIIIGNKTGLLVDYNIKNAIDIPVMIHKDYIGMICLTDGEYDESTVELITPLISLTQLIIYKHKLMEDYKKLYSDTSYASKDLFLANMSHEIRTPLNGVVGYNQLLMLTPLNKTQETYLDSMNQCSIQLMTIINDILDFSRLTSGNMPVTTECFPVKDIITTVKHTLGQKMSDKKQECTFKIHSDVPYHIICDKQKLIQIMINILSNANKFAGVDGKINVDIKSQDEDTLLISVKDNGIGISEQEQCKLFNTFVQIQASLCKNGTGLGLAISKRLVELMNGTISVKSALGIGSVFSFTIKYTKFEEFEKIMNNDIKLLEGKLVLVVDDNIDNRIVLSSMIFEWNMIPIMCASAMEASSLISEKRYKFDIALIDICMPGMSGTDLASQIKSIDPFLPLIALSSLDTYVHNTNFFHKLDKPINKIQLFSVIHKTITRANKNSVCLVSESSISLDKIDINLEKNCRILIAEDITYNRRLLATMLSELGYTKVDEAENGKVAFDMIKKSHSQDKKYEVLLLDLRMPIMDGYDVIDAMKKNGYSLPKIIVVTASTMDFDRKRCSDKCVEYFITKPIDMSQLNDVMNDARMK